MSTIQYTLKHANEFQKRYKGESDRAVAILAAVYLENCLEEYLRLRLVEGAGLERLFNPLGPLGGFSAKIELAFAVGLLPVSVRDDLRRINKVRNLFAHKLDPQTFDSPDIKALCDQFWIEFKDGTKKRFPTGRIAFLGAAFISIINLDSERNQVTRFKAPKSWTAIDESTASTPAKAS